jgi:putative transposase
MGHTISSHKLIKADNCMSAATLLKSAGGHGWKVKRIRRRAQALRTKVRNVIRDLHRKTCSLLCANFNAIFLPPLDVTGMSQVGNRVINNKAVRNLMTFARQFRVTLNRYAADRGVIVTPVGGLHHKHTHVVGSKTMWARARHVSCSGCGLRMERDIASSQRCIEVSDTLSEAS